MERCWLDMPETSILPGKSPLKNREAKVVF